MYITYLLFFFRSDKHMILHTRIFRSMFPQKSFAENTKKKEIPSKSFLVIGMYL